MAKDQKYMTGFEGGGCGKKDSGHTAAPAYLSTPDASPAERDLRPPAEPNTSPAERKYQTPPSTEKSPAESK